MYYYVVQEYHHPWDASEDGGHYFLEAARGGAKTKRHPGVAENACVCDESGEVTAVWVQGYLQVALAEVKL